MELRVGVAESDPCCNCDERLALRKLINQFADAMLTKLEAKLDEGYSGWDEPSEFPVDEIKKRLIEHVEFDDPVDVANFAAFWWNHLSSEAAEAAGGE